MILAAVVSMVCFISSVSAEPQEVSKQPQATNKQVLKDKKQELADNFAKELGLTAEQQVQIKEQRAQQQKESLAARENLKAKNQELKQELEKSVIDEAKVNSLISQITALRDQQLKSHVGSVIAMKKILTPEQQEKMKSKHQERQKNIEQKRGPMKARIKRKCFSK